jgi:hypothetical protein
MRFLQKNVGLTGLEDGYTLCTNGRARQEIVDPAGIS